MFVQTVHRTKIISTPNGQLNFELHLFQIVGDTGKIVGEYCLNRGMPDPDMCKPLMGISPEARSLYLAKSKQQKLQDSIADIKTYLNGAK